MSDLSKARSELYAAVSLIDEHQHVLPAIIEHEKEMLANSRKMLQEYEGETDPKNLEKPQKSVAKHKENVELFITLQKTNLAINKLQINWLCRTQALEFALGRTAKTSSENTNSDEFINKKESEAA